MSVCGLGLSWTSQLTIFFALLSFCAPMRIPISTKDKPESSIAFAMFFRIVRMFTLAYLLAFGFLRGCSLRSGSSGRFFIVQGKQELSLAHEYTEAIVALHNPTHTESY